MGRGEKGAVFVVMKLKKGVLGDYYRSFLLNIHDKKLSSKLANKSEQAQH